MAKPGVMFYFDIRPCLKRLSIEEKGVLFESILDYAEYGSEPNFDGAIGVAWDFIQLSIDRDSERYRKQVLQKQYAVYSREAKKYGFPLITIDDWKMLSDDERCQKFSDIERHRMMSFDNEGYPTTTTTSTSTSTTTSTTATTTESKADKPPARSHFSPPTVDEVKAYCTEKGYALDADRFVDYYTSNGWMVGRTKMKDWKASVRMWIRKEQPNGKTESKPEWTFGTVV